MKAIRREIRRVGLDYIYFSYESIAEYLVAEWGLSPYRAEIVEDRLTCTL